MPISITRCATALLIGVAVAVGAVAPVVHAGLVSQATAQCLGTGLEATPQDAAAADMLMRGRLEIPPHPAVKLPRNLSWRENPLHDVNWQFNLHALRWADVL